MSNTSNIFEVVSPVDGQVLIKREYASEADIANILAASKAAAKGWRETPLQARKALVSQAIDWFVSQKDRIAEGITKQIGRPIAQSAGEVRGLEERARYMLSIADEALADFYPEPKEGFKRFLRREPLGTVLVLAPWNYPFLTAINTIVPALVAGNCVILKHSSQVPLVSDIFDEAFKAVGLPAGVFQVADMTHEDTAKLIDSEGIDFVAFTGSVEGGRTVQRAAASRFIGMGLELGGKDPAYVRADADLDNAVENLVDGAFFNSGQSCCGIERIYVHESLYKDFVAKFVEMTKGYRFGNPMDPNTNLGPMVRASSADFVRKQIAEAVAAGAKALIPTGQFENDKEGTAYLAPQVLVDVDHSMRVMTEESFGPVIGIMSVKDDAEALKMMNDSDFGLTASIWTKDEAAAMQMADQIETGTVFMNRCDYLDPALAWTGVKDTGRGVSLSVLGYAQLTRVKSIHFRTA